MCGEVVGIGKKSIVIKVTAEREKSGQGIQQTGVRDKVATAEFVFVSVGNEAANLVANRPDYLPYTYHGIKNEAE